MSELLVISPFSKARVEIDNVFLSLEYGFESRPLFLSDNEILAPRGRFSLLPWLDEQPELINQSQLAITYQ